MGNELPSDHLSIQFLYALLHTSHHASTCKQLMHAIAFVKNKFTVNTFEVMIGKLELVKHTVPVC